jgi:hypothetical protein
VAQGLLPALLQGRSHQAIGRIDSLVPPFGQVHLIAGALPLVLPVLLQPGAFPLDIVPRLATQL